MRVGYKNWSIGVTHGWSAQYDQECITITPVANDAAFQLSSAIKKSGTITDDEIDTQAAREAGWGASSLVSFASFRGRTVSYLLNGVAWRRLWLANENNLIFATINGPPKRVAAYEHDLLLMLNSLAPIPPPLRIYADFNGIVTAPKNAKRKAVVLDTFGSLRDLANAGVSLFEGLPLIAVDYSDELDDLEGHGTAEYDRANGWWVVEFDDQGVRFVPAGNREPVITFLCVKCKAPLHELLQSRGLKLGDTCPSCGNPIHSPLAPPVGR